MAPEFIVELSVLIILIIQFIVIIILFSKTRQGSQDHVLQKLIDYDSRLDKNESTLRDEFGKNREETNRSAKESREELSSSLKSVSEQLSTTITNFTGLVDNKIKSILESLDHSSKTNREELAASLKAFEEKSSLKIEALTKDTKDSLDKNRDTVEKKLADIQKDNGRKTMAKN
jgi:DNA recombination protein RmuC